MSLSDRIIRNHDCLMLIFICIYACMYVVSNEIIIVLCQCLYICIYVCMYVCMLLLERVIRNHSYGGMIAYAGE